MELLFFIFIGLFLGSFYTVVGDRWSNDQSIVKPGSFCPNCKHSLSWYELIPVFSFIFLKGKCRKCKNKISPFCLMMELLTGALFGFSYYMFGFSYELIIALILSSLTVVTIVSDFKYLLILDIPLMISVISILITKYFAYGEKQVLWSIVSGICMYLFLKLVKLIGDKHYKRESLGEGDVKLMALFGVTITPYLSFIALVVAAFLTYPFAIYYIYNKKESEIPFGPFLLVALMIVYTYSIPILEFIDNLMY